MNLNGSGVYFFDLIPGQVLVFSSPILEVQKLSHEMWLHRYNCVPLSFAGWEWEKAQSN